MSVSRDFIDFYSPKARDQRRRRGFLYGATDRDCAPITLAIGFRVRHYLGQTLITFGEARCFILALAQESLDRLMQGGLLRRLRHWCRRGRRRAGSVPPYPHRSPSPGARGSRPANIADPRPAASCARSI